MVGRHVIIKLEFVLEMRGIAVTYGEPVKLSLFCKRSDVGNARLKILDVEIRVISVT